MVFGNNFEEWGAESFHLAHADAVDPQHFRLAAGLLLGHLRQAGVIEDHVGRHALVVGQAFAQLAQAAEQRRFSWFSREHSS